MSYATHILAHLKKHPDQIFTTDEIVAICEKKMGKVRTTAVSNTLSKMPDRYIEMVNGNNRTRRYRLGRIFRK